MAITVTHKFVSTIPDGDDTTVVRPSNWNDTHELVGLGTMAEQNANAVDITGGSITGVTVSGYVPTTRTLTAGTGLTGGGDLSANRTFAIGNTGVTAASYGSSSKTLTATVNAQGQLTALADTNIAITNLQVSGLGTASTKDAGVALGVATLDAAGKVPLSEIPDSIIGALSYQGTWNASTNTPTLTSSVGTKGYYYVVSVAGTTDLNGITDWQVGDWAVYSGTAWQKIDNTDSVTSVNGFTGAVVLTTTNIAEGTNLYYTDARARAAISAGTGLSYNSTTGAMNFSTAAVGTWAATPSSANLAAAMTDETGSGSLVFATSPTLSGPTIDGASPFINMTPTTAPTYAEGRVFYDSAAHTLNYYNDNNQMSVNIGQEQIIRVRNQTGSDIPDGSVVYVSGATGNTPTVALAIATAFNTSDIIGVTTTTVANNGFGYATVNGLVNGLDTSAFADGNPVFLSATTAGAFTATEPTAPNYSVQVGVIVRANPSVGTLLVAPQQISTEVSHIIGTVTVAQGGTGQTSYTNGQLLIGNTTGNTLTKSTLTAGTAIGITNGAGSITINNTGVTSAVAGTGISVSSSTGAVTFTNTAPDQTVAISSGTGISVTGTYPNFTVTNTAPSLGGTVTSVSGTGTVNGLTLTGTVTSSGSLTLGGTLDLSSPPAIGGTTPAAITGTTITATKFVGVSGGTF